jgi:Mrp family chromosome partitioning ATPase
LPTGKFPPNPTELLASGKLVELFDQLKKKAEVIIVDAPPFVVTDAAVLASRTDGIIIVIQVGHTDKNAIKAMMDQLQSIDTPVLGIVANQHRKKPSYYTEYYSAQTDN